MKRITINIPTIPYKAEFPLFFLIIFLPAYLAQTAMPPGLFDLPAFHSQSVLQALLVISLILYLFRKTPSQDDLYPSAFAGELRITHMLITLGGLAVLYCLYTLILPFLFPPGMENPVLITRGIMLVPSLITCLCAASMEELFFRGYGYFRLRQSGLTPLSSVLIINTLFSLGHLYEGVPAALFAFVSGLFLAFLVLKKISLFSMGAAHGIFNFLMILLSFLSGKGSL
ncbi:MAG: type II CAAX endopeptidase family protein [Spirochaetales bacterium]|nr:type II CAAX endopeptidase family protein [Spirochaetales bacterium]